MEIKQFCSRFFNHFEKPEGIFGIISLFSFFLISFFLPLSNKLPSVFIIVAAANMIISGRLFRRWNMIFKARLNYVFIGWYVLHVLSLSYSENMHYAMKDLETKLSFLVFPLLVFTSSLTPKQIRLIFFSFTAGCLVACMICLAKAIGWYQYNHNMKYFLYTTYSQFMHVTYFSIYLNIAVLFLIFDLDFNWDKVGKILKIVTVVILVFLIINITQLNARTATFTAYLTILVSLIYLFWRRALYTVGIMVVSVSVIFFGILQYEVLHINSGRLKQMTDLMYSKTNESESNSTTIRIHLWRNAWELILEKPFLGVGIGDLKEELMEKYRKNNFSKGILYRYSPHNQYIHSTVILGFLGLLVLLLMLGIPMVLAWNYGQWMYFYFLVVVLLNNFTESILEVQKGVIFFALLNALFYYNLVKRSVSQEIESEVVVIN